MDQANSDVTATKPVSIPSTSSARPFQKRFRDVFGHFRNLSCVSPLNVQTGQFLCDFALQ